MDGLINEFVVLDFVETDTVFAFDEFGGLFFVFEFEFFRSESEFGVGTINDGEADFLEVKDLALSEMGVRRDLKYVRADFFEYEMKFGSEVGPEIHKWTDEMIELKVRGPMDLDVESGNDEFFDDSVNGFGDRLKDYSITILGTG